MNLDPDADAPTDRPDGAAGPVAPPPAAPLTPMDLGQIVDAVVALYRRRWALLLGLCAVLEVPATILSGLILLPLPARLTAIVGFDIFDPPTTIDPSRVVATPTSDQTMGILGPIWLSALVSIIAGTLTTIAVIYAVVRLRLGQDAGVGSSFRAVLRRLGRIILAFAAYTIALLGLIALAVAARGPSVEPVAGRRRWWAARLRGHPGLHRRARGDRLRVHPLDVLGTGRDDRRDRAARLARSELAPDQRLDGAGDRLRAALRAGGRHHRGPARPDRTDPRERPSRASCQPRCCWCSASPSARSRRCCWRRSCRWP